MCARDGKVGRWVRPWSLRNQASGTSPAYGIPLLQLCLASFLLVSCSFLFRPFASMALADWFQSADPHIASFIIEMRCAKGLARASSQKGFWTAGLLMPRPAFFRDAFNHRAIADAHTFLRRMTMH
jgi:hypothetical protein